MLRLLGVGLLLAVGVGGAARAQGTTQFDGKYMGELTLTKTVRGDCTRPPLGSLYPLIISRGEVRFTYAPRFGTTLNGTVDDQGILKASTRLRKGSIQMTGRIQGGIHLTAYIFSPSCNYTFQTRN
jgi:hypothetical protein